MLHRDMSICGAVPEKVDCGEKDKEFMSTLSPGLSEVADNFTNLALGKLANIVLGELKIKYCISIAELDMPS